MTEHGVVVDNDQRLVFGWAQVIKTRDGKVVFDRQRDMVTAEEELAKAAYSYVLKSRDGGEMHLNRGVSTVVESMVFTEEKMAALGIAKGSVPVGWWVGFRVHDDSVWEKVKKGEYTAFSVHGSGKRRQTKVRADSVSTPNRDWIDRVRQVLSVAKACEDVLMPTADIDQAIASIKQTNQ